MSHIDLVSTNLVISFRTGFWWLRNSYITRLVGPAVRQSYTPKYLKNKVKSATTKDQNQKSFGSPRAKSTVKTEEQQT